ncbi:MAG: hypothetical protein LM565_00530 [Thermofilum sp.]|nr:hypothetical protein [Thermofilum sp.]
MRRWAVALATLLAVVSLAAFAVKAQPVFTVHDAYWQAPPTAGVNNALVVVLKYSGASGNLTLKANLTVRGVAGRDLTASANYSGYLAQGALIPLRFQLDLPEGPYASYYPARLEVSCNGSSTTLGFQVGFTGSPSFSVAADKGVLRKGEVNQVTITVTVEGAPARNVEIRATPASAFLTVLGGSLSREGLMGVGERLALPLSVIVDSAAGDSVALTVTVSYEDFARNPGTQTVTIGFQAIRAKGLPFFACSLSPSRVISGQRYQMYLYLTNTGPSTARDVKVSVSSLSPGVAVLSGSSASLGDFAPGETKAMPLLVRADRAAVGVAQLQLTLTYYDEYGDARASTVSVGFEVARSPSPLLAVKLLNGTLPYGLNSRLVISIINLGDAAAVDVSVDATPGAGVYVLEAARVRVRRVEAGCSVEIPLTVRAAPTESSATITFRLEYYDESGERYADALQVSFNVSRSNPSITLTPLNRTLYPNRVNRVVVLVRNAGSAEARNVTVALTSQSPEIGAVVGPSTVNLGSLAAGASAEVAFDVFVQPKVYGALQLVAAASYSAVDGRSFRDLYALGFEVHGDWELSVASLVTVPPVVFPGDKLVRLAVTLVNSGDYMARNVEVRFLGGEWVKPSTASGAEAFIPYLPVGQAVTLYFLADVSDGAPLGNHKLAINASGRLLYFTLTVLEKASFRIRNVTSLEVERGGRGYKLVYEVENTSNSTAENLRIEILSPFARGTTSVYLGTLNPRERKLASFEVDVDSSAPVGELPIDVRVSWTQEGRSLSQYIRSALYVREPRGVSPLAVAAALAAAAAVLAYYKRGSLKALATRLRGGREGLRPRE